MARGEGTPEVPRFGVFQFYAVDRLETEELGLDPCVVEIEFKYKWWNVRGAPFRHMRMLIKRSLAVELADLLKEELP